MKKIILTLLFLNCVFIAAAQEDVTADNATVAPSEQASDASIQKPEKSDYDKKLDVLRYGLTSDVINLVGELQATNDVRFNEELKSVFASDKNIKLKSAIIAFFIVQKDEALKNEVTEMLVNFYDYKSDILKAGMQYAAQLKLQDASVKNAIHRIIDENKTEVKEAAILTLGQIGSADDAVYLTEVFENETGNDANTGLVFRQAIMQALIDLHATETFDFLKEIAEDEYQNAIIRARAITALGKIGNAEAIPILVKAFANDEPNIREAAVAGLAGFSGNAEATEILLQAFKDEYYKVRLKALDVARETKNLDALPFILYRAKTDPERVVKNAAIEIIAQSSDAESIGWLKEVFADEASGNDVRVKIASALLKNNNEDILSEIEQTIMRAMSDKKKKKFAYELGKNISKIENSQLVKICEVFLNDSDSMYKSIGLDIFETNRFTELLPIITQIAEDKKSGTLKNRAVQILEKIKPANNATDEVVNSSEPTSSK